MEEVAQLWEVIPFAILATSPNAGVSASTSTVLEIVEPELVQMVEAISPIGESSLGVRPTFSWEESLEAETYFLELATDPAFASSLVWSIGQVSASSYSMPIDLQPNTVYYWRITGENACGLGLKGATNAFQTGTCELATTNAPVLIPAFGQPAIATSTVSISSSTQIGSVKVTDVKGIHSSIIDVEMSVKSPAGTEVVLFSEICDEQDEDFEMSFVEGGLSTFDCPPNLGIPISLMRASPFSRMKIHRETGH